MKHRAILLALLPAVLWAQEPGVSPDSTTSPSATGTLAGTPDGAGLVRAIQELQLDPDHCYPVRDLSFTRDDIKLYLNDGYLIFAKPVAGRRVAAVFMGDEDLADGEILLLPPDQDERTSLAKFTRTPNLDEHFTSAILAFSDSTEQELFNEIRYAGRGVAPPEVSNRLVQLANPALQPLTGAIAQRLVLDLLSPERPSAGFLIMSLDTERLGTFDVVHDPAADDQILAGQFKESGGVVSYDVWTSFRSRAAREGRLPPVVGPFSVSSYRIRANFDNTLRMKAATHATFAVGGSALRVLQFAISRAEAVSSVRLDGVPATVLFQDSARSRALRANENDVFLVVAPEALQAGTTHEIEFEHSGQVIEDRGSGVYAVSARANWYPRNTMEFAHYELEFRYPEQLTLVASGDLVSERTEAGIRITRRKTPAPIRVAGFNMGQYERVSKRAGDFEINVFGYRGLDPALAPKPLEMVITQPVRPLYRGAPPTRQTTTIITQLPPPDPLARLEAVAEDVSQAMRFYAESFGAPGLKTLTVSPIPGTSGQGFPGLIYLSTLSYLREEERPKNLRESRQQTLFTDLMVAHEVAHQWWGNLVAARGYQDEWMMEALAHYSALLWLEKKRGTSALDIELSNYREDLLASGDDGILGGYGPLTWGYRLEGARSPDTWRVITYEKGAWVFHMLRKRMGDARFLAMLQELRNRFSLRAVSTADLQELVREFGGRAAASPNDPPPFGRIEIESFFRSWIWSAGIPDVRIRYEQSGRAPTVRVIGTAAYAGSQQRRVTRDFETEIPLQIEFTGGEKRIEWVPSSDGGETFRITLTRAPAKISVAPALTLATGR